MMKYTEFFFLLTIPAFAQNPPSENAAASLMKNRIQSMRLLNLPKLKSQISLKQGAIQISRYTQWHTCAIPLTNAAPPADSTAPMPIAQQPGAAVLKGDVIAAMTVCQP